MTRRSGMASDFLRYGLTPAVGYRRHPGLDPGSRCSSVNAAQTS